LVIYNGGVATIENGPRVAQTDAKRKKGIVFVAHSQPVRNQRPNSRFGCVFALTKGKFKNAISIFSNISKKKKKQTGGETFNSRSAYDDIVNTEQSEEWCVGLSRYMSLAGLQISKVSILRYIS